MLEINFKTSPISLPEPGPKPIRSSDPKNIWAKRAEDAAKWVGPNNKHFSNCLFLKRDLQNLAANNDAAYILLSHHLFRELAGPSTIAGIGRSEDELILPDAYISTLLNQLFDGSSLNNKDRSSGDPTFSTNTLQFSETDSVTLSKIPGNSDEKPFLEWVNQFGVEAAIRNNVDDKNIMHGVSFAKQDLEKLGYFSANTADHIAVFPIVLTCKKEPKDPKEAKEPKEYTGVSYVLVPASSPAVQEDPWKLEFPSETQKKLLSSALLWPPTG